MLLYNQYVIVGDCFYLFEDITSKYLINSTNPETAIV